MNWQKIGQYALGGFAAAALIDFEAFRKWKSFDEALKYDWGLALWRWFQGAVVGVAIGLGYGGAA